MRRVRSSDKLVGVRAWYSCNSGLLRQGVSERICNFYENEAYWQGDPPVCETSKTLNMW